MQLADLGWDAGFAAAFEPYEQEGLMPARVARRHHGPCVLLAERGALGGLPAAKLSERELPAVGDWVAARQLPGERKAVIEAVLPRRSAFTRKEAWRRTAEQVVAANLDVAFVVTSFGADLNPRRLERYLTAAWESGASPVIVVTKADLSADVAAELAAVEAVALGVPVHAVSNVTGQGVDGVRRHLARGKTVALLGSSGVGKSTLANRLLGRELLRTGDLRADGRGRHTTTWRELVVVPGGGVLLDTPGLRELQLWAGEDSLDQAFDDVASLAAECRFRDCQHDREPGCAVLAAVDSGALDRDRLSSYRSLQRELRALAVRQDRRLQLDQRRRWRALERSRRRAQRGT